MAFKGNLYRWSPGSGSSENVDLGPLDECLQPLERDRASSASDIVTYAAREFARQTRAKESPWSADEIARCIEEDLAGLRENHAWRGPCARFFDGLRAWWHDCGSNANQTALLEELEAWSEPHGARRISTTELEAHAAEELETGETVLVLGYSETVARTLARAWKSGKAPNAICSEGAPQLDGRRMARLLVQAGVTVTYVYDSSLYDQLPRADRVWLGTESIGSAGFVARAGTQTLVERARELELPVQVLANSDKLVPGGELDLPAWCEREPWLLWEDAPEGVRLESQAYELVPHMRGAFLLTEIGPETASELSVRALETHVSPPCDVSSLDTEHELIPQPNVHQPRTTRATSPRSVDNPQA